MSGKRGGVKEEESDHPLHPDSYRMKTQIIRFIKFLFRARNIDDRYIENK